MLKQSMASQASHQRKQTHHACWRLFVIIGTYHWVRDVILGEDGSQVHCGNAPQVMAALRNTAIGLMRSAGRTNIAAACREFAAKPAMALKLVGISI